LKVVIKMLNLEDLRKQFNNIDFSEKRPDLFQVIIPYFYPDGDMYDIFIEDLGGNIRISDYGLTLMKLSYSFDIDTDHREEVLSEIISQNRCAYNDGNIFLDIKPRQFEGGLYQFIGAISKVSAMNMMSRNITQSEFYKLLNDFMLDSFSKLGVKSGIHPTDDDTIKVDYLIPAQKPIYLFGVDTNDKASKVVIDCMDLQKNNHNFRSLIIPNDIDKLNKYYRRKLINHTDKQFASFSDFKMVGASYIDRELTIA